MTPLGWGWAAFVWGYALLWFLVSDRVKLMAYRVFDPTAAPLLVKKNRFAKEPRLTKRGADVKPRLGEEASLVRLNR